MSTTTPPLSSNSVELPHRQLLSRSWFWFWTRPGWFLVACVMFSVILRLQNFVGALGIDEGGYALVAGQWAPHGTSIYGDLWLDRPPLLLALYRLALELGGDVGIRILGCVAAGAIIVGTASAARTIAGHRAGNVAAMIAAVLASTAAIQADGSNAELLAAAWVAPSVALLLRALATDHRWRQFGWALASGACAAGALLVKQSFIDAAVFGIVLLAGRAISRRVSTTVILSWLGGIATVAAITLTWALSSWGPGIGPLWEALVAFRGQAIDIIRAGSHKAPTVRALLLLGTILLTGILPLIVLVSIRMVRRFRRDPALTLALLAMLALATAGTVLGGSFWRHYMVQFIPALAICSGIVWARGPKRAIFTPLIAWMVLAAIAVNAGAAVYHTQRTNAPTVARTFATWLHDSADSADTAVISWGHPNVLHDADMQTTYPYLWSLQVRAFDPELAVIRKQLADADRGPTWLVQWSSDASWQLDDSHQYRDTRARYFERVATVCGHRVYLRRGVSRVIEPVPTRCGGGSMLGIAGLPML